MSKANLPTIGQYMVKVERSLLIAHSAQRMFDLVEDIEAYPDFLPRSEEHTSDPQIGRAHV